MARVREALWDTLRTLRPPFVLQAAPEGGEPSNSGVTEDQKYVDLRSDFEPIAFLSDMQALDPDSDATILARSDLQPDVLIPQLRREPLNLNPALVLQFSQLKDDIAEQLVAERLMAMLAGFFGAFCTYR